MGKILIFGNSGSGKSTLAKRLSKGGLAHLDLDTLAWMPTIPPQRMPLKESQLKIEAFIETHKDWVIEGCYTDLLELLANHASEIIFMDLSIDQCIVNAKNRPWEPHKYESKEAQDSNLDMLINWIKEYKNRHDTFSYQSHLNFYNAFQKKKVIYNENQENI
ncbi:AAA family ATPase [Microbulbifer variabilis]|uniref:AAA family ATPase n=1 Tax=Microbulbifer variabilis TaxID=266805 RepID=UPI001CFD9916|nr:AAA family ATPase [Microbulbifer variabilis]